MILSTLALLSIPIKLGLSLTYDEDLARRLVHFCGAVYCIDDEAFGNSYENLVFDWECETCTYLRQTSEIESVYPFQDTNFFIDSEGMITYDSLNDAITVVFAGTDPTEIADIVTDIELIRVEYPPCGGTWFWEDDCTVHKGFWKAYKSVKDTVYDIVKSLKDDHPSATLEITGHSLGGAMAILCAVDLVEGHSTSIVADYVYTFGQPRVGDDEFVEHYESTFGSGKTFRVTHEKDPVPLVPWTTWGWNYLHGPQEVYYPSDPDGDYEICSSSSGEDPDCIQQHNWWEVLLNVFIITDHLQYLSVDFFTAVIECNIGLDIDGDNAGAAAPNNGTQNATYEHYVNVVLNWTRLGTTLYTPHQIRNSIGLQQLLVYSLKEAAVEVRYGLLDDSHIGASIMNVSHIEEGVNETMSIGMKVWFYELREQKGFKIDQEYVLQQFDTKLKTALSLLNVTEVIIYEDTDGTTGIETTPAPGNNNGNDGCSCDNNSDDDSSSNEEQNAKDEEDDGIEIWVIIVIGLVIIAVVAGLYAFIKYRSGENEVTVSKRKKTEELSGKDQFAVGRVTSTSPGYGPTGPDSP